MTPPASNKPMMKKILFLAVMMFPLSLVLAQNTENPRLQKVEKWLEKGNCREAERAYRLYKAEGNKFISDVESRIDDCKNADPVIKTFSANGVSFNMVLADDGLYLGETEVTQILWQAVMDTNPSEYKKDYFPVEKVSWNECNRFIEKLNAITGLDFRMPTFAELDSAACGGKKTKNFNFAGSNNINDVAWYKRNAGETTHYVKTKRPNELGLYDIQGNVREWCSEKVYNRDTEKDMVQSYGGSWYDEKEKLLKNVFYTLNPAEAFPYIGLRLALEQ